MKKILSILFLLLGIFFLQTSDGRANDPGESELDQFRASCSDAAAKFCPGIPRGPEVLSCLSTHESEISSDCKDQVQELKKHTLVSPRGQAPFLPLGPLGIIPPQYTVINYSGWIEPQSGSGNAQSMRLNAQTPIHMDEKNIVSVGLGGSTLHIEDAPALSETDALVPSNLSSIQLSGQYLRQLDNQKTLGAQISVGSASDYVFSNNGVTTVTASAQYSFPENERSRWLFLVFFSNNSTVVSNYVPIPGAEYIYNTKTFSGTFGFPFDSLRWMPAEDWTMYLSLLGPNLISEVALGDPFKSQVFVGFNWGAQSFIQRDRINGTDRLYFAEKRAQVGGRVLISSGLSAELDMGYAFNRNIYVQEHYFFTSQGNSSSLDSSWFSELNLRLAL